MKTEQTPKMSPELKRYWMTIAWTTLAFLGVSMLLLTLTFWLPIYRQAFLLPLLIGIITFSYLIGLTHAAARIEATEVKHEDKDKS